MPDERMSYAEVCERQATIILTFGEWTADKQADAAALRTLARLVEKIERWVPDTPNGYVITPAGAYEFMHPENCMTLCSQIAAGFDPAQEEK